MLYSEPELVALYKLRKHETDNQKVTIYIYIYIRLELKHGISLYRVAQRNGKI
jgi:hypothetical protein